MWKLLVRYGEAGDADFPLVCPMEVGRDPECQIWFDEPQVSHRHARFFLIEQSAFIEDLDSANGVFQNGQRVQGQSELRPGDILVVGGHKMLVTWSSEGPVPPPRDDTARGLTAGVESIAQFDERDPWPRLARPEPAGEQVEDLPPERPAKKERGCLAVLAVAAMVIAVLAWSV